MGKRLPILTQPFLIGVRVLILHEEDFVLSVRIAQGSNQVNGVFKCSPVGKQLLNKLIPRFCTDDRLEHLSECRRHFGEDIVDHGSQS